MLLFGILLLLFQRARPLDTPRFQLRHLTPLLAPSLLLPDGELQYLFQMPYKPGIRHGLADYLAKY